MVLPQFTLRSFSEAVCSLMFFLGLATRTTHSQPGDGGVPASRTPLAVWPRAVPFDGNPETTPSNNDFLTLFLYARCWPAKVFGRAGGSATINFWPTAFPGARVAPNSPYNLFARSLAAITVVELNTLHYYAEDDPHTVGTSFMDWRAKL